MFVPNSDFTLTLTSIKVYLNTKKENTSIRYENKVIKLIECKLYINTSPFSLNRTEFIIIAFSSL